MAKSFADDLSHFQSWNDHLLPVNLLECFNFMFFDATVHVQVLQCDIVQDFLFYLKSKLLHQMKICSDIVGQSLFLMLTMSRTQNIACYTLTSDTEFYFLKD